MAQNETKEGLPNNSTDELNHTISKEASPESKCPICLDHFKNISYLNVCLHKFCFLCICEWSKNKAECPLCKQPFRSIYHTIKAENDYKRFDLRPTENGSFGNVAGQRFRYRTTLTGDHRPAPRRTSPPPDHGILFEGISGSLPQHQNRDLHRMMRRMEARRRAESEGRSLRSLREQEVVKFRRALYRRGVRVRSVQDGGRSRETSAEFFRKNPACLHRLVPWLRRELTVLYGTHGSFANILQHIIMTLITRHNLEDQAVLHELRPFLLSHTEHFLHEFLRFAQSPFNMEAYDQYAIYDLPGPATESSSSDTSVIAISEDESDSSVPESQEFTTPGVTLSQTAWDDETPGPSYSSEPPQVFPLHVRDSDSDSSVEEAVSVAAVTHHDHSSESDEDCVIVGYVKPVKERTPELVKLSSDSEEPEENEGPQSPRPPQHIRFTSESPPVTQRPSGMSRRGSYSPEDTAHLHTSNRARHEENSDKMHHKRELSKERSSHRNRTHSSSHKDGKREKRREQQPSNGTSSYWHSYSRYRDSDRRYYTETHSSYTSYYTSAHDRSHSRSRSRRRSKDRQKFRSRSWSNSRISSSSSKRHGRSHSRSNSRINSSSSRLTSNHEEDGRKRKYKIKHLDSRKSSEKSGEYHCKKKKKEKKHHKKSRKKSRSPSIDAAYDDKSEHSRKHHKKRKKHKKKSKHTSKGRIGNHSPDLITLATDSDSGNTDTTEPSDRNVCSVSSTVVISDSAKTQLLKSSFVDVEQQAAAANKCSSIADAENHP